MLQKFILVFNIIAIAGTIVFFYGTSVFNIMNVLILSVCVLIVFFAKYLLNKFHNIKQSLNKISNISEIYKSVILAIDDYWVIFDEDFFSKGISDNMADLLGVSNAEVSLSRFLNIFKDSLKFEEFNIALSDLKTFGKEMNITIQNAEKVFNVKARKFAVNGDISYIFVMQDITNITSRNVELEKENKILKGSVDLLNAVLDAIPMPIWARNQNAELRYCNAFYADIIGESKENVINDNIPIVKGEIFGGGNSLAKNVQKTGKQQEILQNVNVNGERQTFDFVEVPMNDNSTVGYALNKTHEEIALKELDKTIIANQDVLEMLSTGIVIFGADMKLRFFNSSYQKLMEMEETFLHSTPKIAEVLEEMRIRRKIPDTIDFKKYKKDKINLFTSIFQSYQECEYLPNGKCLRVMTYPNPLGGIILLYEDITDSLILERKHNSLIETQKETIENLYEGIAVYGSDSKVKVVNPAFARIWGLQNGEVSKGFHIADVVEKMKRFMNYGDDWEFYKANLVENLTDRIPKTGKIFRTDNSVINFSYIPLSDGTHVHSYIDITDSWRVEKALSERNNALQESDTIKSKFINALSDELIEPIDKIITLSSNLENKLSSEIIVCSNELKEIIVDLKDFVSIENGLSHVENKELYLDALISDSVRISKQRIINKDITLKYNADKWILLIGDYKRLRHMFVNLIINSYYGSVTDEIILDVEEDKDEGNINFTIKNIIADEDEIIKNGIIDKLPANLMKIIEIHGGKIIAFSKNKYTKFYLPIYRKIGSSDEEINEIIA